MEKFLKDYEVGDQLLDNVIRDLAKKSSSLETEYLLREILTTSAKLGKESIDRGDLKLVNSTLKEFLNLPRLVMNFNLRDYGRLCEMIQVINKD